MKICLHEFLHILFLHSIDIYILIPNYMGIHNPRVVPI